MKPAGRAAASGPLEQRTTLPCGPFLVVHPRLASSRHLSGSDMSSQNEIPLPGGRRQGPAGSSAPGELPPGHGRSHRQSGRPSSPDPADLEDLRHLSTAIRSRSLLNLPDLLEEFRGPRPPGTASKSTGRNLRGGQRAGSVAFSAPRVPAPWVKGKSMVSEEMHLNEFSSSTASRPWESDLGSTSSNWMVRHRATSSCRHQQEQGSDRPAIRPENQGRQVQLKMWTELTAMARKVLRQKFLAADAGLSGVNFAVAETGTLCRWRTRADGRMSTHVPPLHIAVMGLERSWHASRTWHLSTPSHALRHGQAVSTYFNLIHGSPGRGGNGDGPLEVHLVILDNGRSRIYADPQLRATLRCIPCGACMNHCPVYTRGGRPRL